MPEDELSNVISKKLNFHVDQKKYLNNTFLLQMYFASVKVPFPIEAIHRSVVNICYYSVFLEALQNKRILRGSSKQYFEYFNCYKPLKILVSYIQRFEIAIFSCAHKHRRLVH